MEERSRGRKRAIMFFSQEKKRKEWREREREVNRKREKYEERKSERGIMRE